MLLPNREDDVDEDRVQDEEDIHVAVLDMDKDQMMDMVA